MVARSGRRERRKADTRRRILDAARQLFAEKGYDATRPQDIARAADVGAGTFYLHFEGKRAAYLAFTDQVAGELQDLIRSRVQRASSFREHLELALDALFEYGAAHRTDLRAATADTAVVGADLPVGSSLLDRLAEGMTRGLETAIAPWRGLRRLRARRHRARGGRLHPSRPPARGERGPRPGGGSLEPEALPGRGPGPARGGDPLMRLRYDADELLESHPFARPHEEAGRRLHGGLRREGDLPAPAASPPRPGRPGLDPGPAEPGGRADGGRRGGGPSWSPVPERGPAEAPHPGGSRPDVLEHADDLGSGRGPGPHPRRDRLARPPARDRGGRERDGHRSPRAGAPRGPRPRRGR